MYYTHIQLCRVVDLSRMPSLELHNLQVEASSVSSFPYCPGL